MLPAQMNVIHGHVLFDLAAILKNSRQINFIIYRNNCNTQNHTFGKRLCVIWIKVVKYLKKLLLPHSDPPVLSKINVTSSYCLLENIT